MQTYGLKAAADASVRTMNMRDETKDQNRTLWDTDARRRLSMRHLAVITGNTILIVIVSILSHVDVIWRRKQFDMSQLFCLAICVMALVAILYSISQVRHIARMTQAPKE